MTWGDSEGQGTNDMGGHNEGQGTDDMGGHSEGQGTDGIRWVDTVKNRAKAGL